MVAGSSGRMPYLIRTSATMDCVGYYAAYVLDPDGNNIEVVNHHRS